MEDDLLWSDETQQLLQRKQMKSRVQLEEVLQYLLETDNI